MPPLKLRMRDCRAPARLGGFKCSATVHVMIMQPSMDAEFVRRSYSRVMKCKVLKCRG